MSEHGWMLIDHLGSLLAILSFLGGVVVWFAKWGKHVFKRWVREAVAAAIAEQIAPIAEKVEEMHPWYVEIRKYVNPRANGKAVGIG